VKAHVGIEGNEMADTFSKEAAQDEDEQNIVYDKVQYKVAETMGRHSKGGVV
jgi:ribonuclease HI